MRERLLSIWETIHTSFWFVPGMMVLGALVLSFVTVSFDQRTMSVKFANSLGFVWSGGAEGARSLLSTIAGSSRTAIAAAAVSNQSRNSTVALGVIRGPECAWLVQPIIQLFRKPLCLVIMRRYEPYGFSLPINFSTRVPGPPLSTNSSPLFTIR